jgi:hypothetical protein
MRTIKQANGVTVEMLQNISTDHYLLRAIRTDKHGYRMVMEKEYPHCPTMHDTLDFILRVENQWNVKLFDK